MSDHLEQSELTSNNVFCYTGEAVHTARGEAVHAARGEAVHTARGRGLDVFGVKHGSVTW